MSCPPWAPLLFALSLAGCHVFMPLGPLASDSGSPVDGPSPDRLTVIDGPAREVPPPADAPAGESVPATEGGPPLEQGLWPLETGPVIPCAPGIQTGKTWTPGPMQLCLASGPVNQCDAEALCNVAGGWHLCTASEYLARGGQTSGSGSTYGWLASCVRSNGAAAKAPSDSACAVCDSEGSVSNSAEVGWECTTGAVQYNMPHYNIGVRTNYGCKRVGKNETATEGYWAPLVSGSGAVATAAVCCAP